MNQQTTLPFVVGSATSKAAAKSMVKSAANIRESVFDLIESADLGVTCDEAEVTLNLKHQTCSARIRELALAGRIHQNGTRPTRSGCAAAVWWSGPPRHEKPATNEGSGLVPEGEAND